jgi:hypothetical protein
MKIGVGPWFRSTPWKRGLTPLFVAPACVALLAACNASDYRPKDDPEFARSLADTATVAAVAKRGARVCREMRVGIAEREWVRGVVVETEGRRVAVRIVAPGRFEHSIAGTKLVRGAVVRDDAAAWTPCL